MKKIIIAAALFLTTFAQAQVVEVYNEDVQIENNGVYTYGVLNGSTNLAKLHLQVINVSANPIKIKLKMFEILNNATGKSVQFCFGQFCYNDAPQGTMAPPGVNGTALAAGAGNDINDYFFNNYAGDVAGQPVSYKMGIVQIDGTGAQVGDPLITFTYKYDPVASTNDFAALQQMGITVSNTLVKNILDVTASQNANLEIFNINGQSVKNTAIVNGSQSIDISGLSSAIYFARFTTIDKKTAQIKIVKN